MNREELKNKIFVGVVEDNKDPKKLGRVRIRVMNVFDGSSIKTEDLPWATPFKDLNGNSFNVPDIGKVVSVVFDQGNPYKPEFIYAEHYNKNLETKLSQLDGKAYTSMRALMFDHKTQIYSNDDEGLKIDYKFNNINIQEKSINADLKDNFSTLNLGDSTASQQAILGNHWMDWFDKFVDNLLGTNGGPYLGNLGSPVVANPTFIDVLLQYKALRDVQFLSKHVNIVDNNQVKKKSRINDGQLGDSWKSTVNKNDKTSKEPNSFDPQDGVIGNVDDPTYIPPKTDGTPDGVGPINDPNATDPSKNDKINKMIRFLKSKNYVIYTEPFKLNIVGMRNKPNGAITNRFDDKLVVFFFNENNNPVYYEYDITTVPGYKPNTNTLPDSVAILALGQYVDQYKIGLHQDRPGYNCLKFATSVIHRNKSGDKYELTGSDTQKGSFGINIHHSGNPQGNFVYNWSQGCVVFKNLNAFNEFMNLCNKQVKEADKSTFTFTLIDQIQFNAFT